ncbi:MAG: DNA translocase FtsK 4TM domain-containing protein [Chloroflexota bacterium]|nr:DNA translocase FtsK 4TM domain-containing protein [Chloroflexota bacterium]
MAALVLAAFFAVIIFLPPEGRIGAPLHDGLASLLGRASFMLPLALVLAGVLLVIRALRPSTPLPRRRLAGTALLALAVLPSEYLLGGGQSSGLIGQLLSTSLLDLLGGPTTLVLLVVVLGLGVLLAFDVRLLRVVPPQAGVSPGQWKDAEG